MEHPVCLITGGNSGIGKAAAIQMASKGARVVIACRDEGRGLAAVSEIRKRAESAAVELVVMDMSSRESIRAGTATFRQLGQGRLDVLIHNAADFDVSRKEPILTPDGVESVWATNHVGPVDLTHQLGPELDASEQGRVITISSQGLILHPRLKVDIADPEFTRGGFKVDKAYYQSKLAQVIYTKWLAEKFRGTTRTANCVRVTNVKVDIERYPNLSSWQKRLYGMKSRFSISPDQMAEVYVWAATAPELASVSGQHFDEKRRSVGSGKWADDPANIRAVMELTEKYVPGVLD
ncbi:MAG: SDR family NAD(P)-dependent oxidoreductase [Pseudolysinimonas sp.]